MKQINFNQITHLHNEWLRGLEFYGQELQILQERLEEIAADNTNHEVAQRVEYFQNQLIIHRDYIDVLRHQINESLKSMELDLAKSNNFVEEDTAVEGDNLQEQYLTEEKLINELRRDFNHFAAKWM